MPVFWVDWCIGWRGDLNFVGASAPEAPRVGAVGANSGEDGAGEPRAGEKGGPGAGKEFNDKSKDRIRDRDGNKRVFCKKDTTDKPGPDRSEIARAESKRGDGNNSENNGQNTCRTCNRQKGVKRTADYLDWLRDRLGG